MGERQATELHTLNELSVDIEAIEVELIRECVDTLLSGVCGSRVRDRDREVL